MKNILLLLTCVITLNATGFAQNPGLINDLNAKFRRFNLIKLDSQVELANVRAGRGMILTIDGRRLSLTVVENDLRSADYRLVIKTLAGDVQVPRPENTTYKGSVVGDGSSSVRLALDGRKVEGVIFTASKEYYIEPAKMYSLMAADDDFIIYEQKDLINRREITCPLVNRVEAGMRMVNAKFSGKSFNHIFARNFSQSFARSLPPGDRILNLSTDADLEYVKIFGGPGGHATQYALIQAIANINETLNVVEGLYENAVDVTFNIPFQGGWLVQDPYNGCETAQYKTECVIDKFRDYWNANRPPSTFDGRNAALLFTNKLIVNYNLAYPGTVCSIPTSAYGMLVNNYSVEGYGNYRYSAAAHEIGHLFSGQHVAGRNLGSNPDCYNSILRTRRPQPTFFRFAQNVSVHHQ